MSEAKLITIVVPFLNEKDNLPILLERVAGVFAARRENWELLLVDDGSTDGSTEWALDQTRTNPHVRLVRLSRNFGHQLAITAGMDRATGDAVVIMDADLQDPPETIAAMLDKWHEGFEVVYAVRRSRAGETWLKKFLAASFYRVFRRLAKTNVPMDAGDFRLVDRCVVDALREMRELHRFMRGLTCWVGFRQVSVEYDRAARLAGETKYPVWKSARLAFDAITSFSASPLRWIAVLGFGVCVLATLWVIYVMVLAIVQPQSLEKGWASLIAVMAFLGGVQLVSIGMLGQYVSRIFEEGKRRPLYLVRSDTRDPAGAK
ncbi:MAG TPA: glycosyltransferase family 2 protein [Kiritimatiellia bacterium]|nr:glycosyltransferase family 2 protein [Kiritimatiellia bacterium]MBP9572330.1 glycosyltransferase family 2 protein [Kiritimatiellia bacterium]HQF20071.1 glycosyltransferase family 2 protein [Kiritimatiellia bacterium]HQG74221.1 glycosyltransferase family 2 protein [Kiritimatiellia bacterium]